MLVTTLGMLVADEVGEFHLDLLLRLDAAGSGKRNRGGNAGQ